MFEKLNNYTFKTLSVENMYFIAQFCLFLKDRTFKQAGVTLGN